MSSRLSRASLRSVNPRRESSSIATAGCGSYRARRLRLVHPFIAQNWLTVEDLENILYLAGFQSIRNWEEILFPARVPGVARLCNSYLARIFPFRFAALTNFMVARPAPHDTAVEARTDSLVSVVVPARNEAGNIAEIFQRVPEMG